MVYYVYVICSLKDGSFYKGISENYIKRFAEHNTGLSSYTASKCPWILWYVEVLPNKRSALIRERKLKKCKRAYFEWLATQPSNILLE
ncbi:GIY-YIG nuclease family protein [Edaphocola flava]|uniref:GIY-YIG nuclease family protein n=1 Tax=Edaphocola flava TaxID=2499629 RepID=UPI00100B87F9